LFVTAGRAAFAAGLAALYLFAVRAALPARRHLPALAVCALGTVVGFPLFLALALRQVDAMHAAVVTGVIPLGTALVAAVAMRQRPSAGFWVCAALGCGLVLGFAAVSGHGRLSSADGLLLLAVASTAFGYVAGARVAAEMPSEQVISWVLVLSLPLTLPVTWWTWPGSPAHWAAWGGFAYVTVFSMWLGFFAWYRGLALGGTMRVSQVQLVQPFLALLFAVPVLGERLEFTTVAFALAVIAIVFVGRRMPVAAR
jgi:drug/metabolite transporter (DMT)-like permease